MMIHGGRRCGGGDANGASAGLAAPLAGVDVATASRHTVHLVVGGAGELGGSSQECGVESKGSKKGCGGGAVAL